MSRAVRAFCVAVAVGFVLLLVVGMSDLAELEDGRAACRTIPSENQRLCSVGVRAIYGTASEQRFDLELAFAGITAVGALALWHLERRKAAV